jgi:NAD-dependent deacetylase
MSIAHEIKHARRAVAFTGAGISAESGLGTFRGKDGLWSRYDPAEVASIESFTQDPRKFWDFAREIGSKFLTAEPNAAHIALAELEAMRRLDSVITQNVDGLHQRAGSKHVVEIHGNAGRIICTRCSATYATRDIVERIGHQEVPRCDRCGGPLKPDVILFGEPLPERAFGQALKKVKSADLLLAVGTSLEVYPAATLPELAKKSGAKVISVDSERTGWDDLCDYEVSGPAGEVLPRIVQAIRITF